MDKPKTYFDHLKPESNRVNVGYFRFKDQKLKEDIQLWCVKTRQHMSRFLEDAAREKLTRDLEQASVGKLATGKKDILIKK